MQRDGLQIESAVEVDGSDDVPLEEERGLDGWMGRGRGRKKVEWKGRKKEERRKERNKDVSNVGLRRRYNYQTLRSHLCSLLQPSLLPKEMDASRKRVLELPPFATSASPPLADSPPPIQRDSSTLSQSEKVLYSLKGGYDPSNSSDPEKRRKEKDVSFELAPPTHLLLLPSLPPSSPSLSRVCILTQERSERTRRVQE